MKFLGRRESEAVVQDVAPRGVCGVQRSRKVTSGGAYVVSSQMEGAMIQWALLEAQPLDEATTLRNAATLLAMLRE